MHVEVSAACGALLGSGRPPLIAALTLHRLDAGSASKLMAAQETKLCAAASSLPPETRRRLSAELDDGLPCLAAAVRSVPANALTTFVAPPSKRQCTPTRASFPRLSECSLWERTKKYYADHGAKAWTSGAVPCHISTSAFIANAYAAVVTAFLSEAESSPLDEPLIILDLGCGAGVLGVRVARELQRRGCHGFCVVLADLDPAAALAQTQLPPAASLVRDGILDVAVLQAVTEGTCNLHLQLSNRFIHCGTLRRPLVVLANYVFDSLPIDLLRVRLRHGACTGVDALIPQPSDETFMYQPILGKSTLGNSSSVREGLGASRASILASDLGGYFKWPEEAELAARLVSAAEADAAAETAGETADEEEQAALAYVCTGALGCLKAIHSLLAPSSGSPMLLLLGEKLVDGCSAARLAAAHKAANWAPLTLSELPLFSVHGSARHGAVSHGVVLQSLLEAMPRGFTILGRSATLMEFDVVALAVDGPTARAKCTASGSTCTSETDDGTLPATRRAFSSQLSRFGAAEMERLTAMVHEAAQAEGPTIRRAARKAARRPWRPYVVQTPGVAVTSAEARCEPATSADGLALPVPMTVPIRLLTHAVIMSGHDWDVFVSLRSSFRDRFDRATSAEVTEAIRVATRCFAERVTLCADDWKRSGAIFKRWLDVAQRRRLQLATATELG